MHDDKEIAIQILPKHLNIVDDNSYLIMIKHLNTITWELDMPREIWINKMATIGDLANIIS